MASFPNGTLSRMPPTGKMCPRKVISPVTAVSLRTGRSCQASGYGEVPGGNSMEISVASDLHTKCGSLSCCPADGMVFFFIETWLLDWMSHVWMWAMSTVHESPWILHGIINTCSIYSMRCHQNLCQLPSMKLIEVFFWEEGWAVSFLPFCGRLHLWDPPVFCQKSPESGYAQSQLVMQLKFVFFWGVTVLSSYSVRCMLLTIFLPSLLAELIMEKSDRGS